MGEVPDITDLLASAGAGDRAIVDEVLPHLYDELRRLAAAQLGEGRSVTIDPTGVVHEAYIRLIHQNRVRWESRGHFLAIAATLIRRIIVDHARARGRQKRGGGWQSVTLSSARLETPEPETDALALNDAFEKLAADYPEKARIVELRFYGGLTNKEIAAVLDVTERTVERHWQFARAWLRRAMAE